MRRRDQTIDLNDQTRDLFIRRLVQDVWAEAEAVYWERRARQLEDARPRRGDFNGSSTPAEITARWIRLTEAAAACRARAQLSDLARDQAEATLADVGAEPLDYVDADTLTILDSGAAA
jgi:hypothetical protein